MQIVIRSGRDPQKVGLVIITMLSGLSSCYPCYPHGYQCVIPIISWFACAQCLVFHSKPEQTKAEEGREDKGAKNDLVEYHDDDHDDADHGDADHDDDAD